MGKTDAINGFLTPACPYNPLMEGTIAVIILAAMPLIGAVLLLARFRRHQQLRDWIRLWGSASEGARGVEHQGTVAPDGKTLIELTKLRLADRDKARQMYERLTNQKLDILKTGVAMGYKQEDLSALDERLEKIIGSDKLASLLGDELPSSDLTAASAAADAARQRSSAPQPE
jgi:hypothetical protein